MEENKKSGLCTAALVMGILCMVTSILPFGNFIFGLLGLIFAIVCLAKKKGSKTKSVWALILSIVGWLLRIILGIVAGVIIFVVVGFGTVLASLTATLNSMGFEDVASTLEDYNTTYNGDDDWNYGDDDWNYGDDDWNYGDDDWNYGDDDWNYGDDDWNYDDDYSYDSYDWATSYLPSGTSVEFQNFRFNVPEGFGVIGSLAESADDAEYYLIQKGSCAYYFPEVIYQYDSGNYEDAYNEILDYWFGYSQYPEGITWEEGGVYYWNEDWYATSVDSLSPMNDGTELYSYCVIAFSTHEDTAIVLTAYPDSNTFDETCADLKSLLDYIEYIG